MDTTDLLTNLTANASRLRAYREYRRYVWCDEQRTEDEIRTDRDALDVCLVFIRADLDRDLDELHAALQTRQQVSA